MAGEKEDHQGLKIIHAGLFRTSTKSMAEAYKILGYKTHHALDEGQITPWAGIEQAAEATWPGVCGARRRRPFERADWDALWGGWDVATDVASPFAAQMAAAYPEARVVVVQRDFEGWWASFDSEVVAPQFMRLAPLLFFLARHLLGYHAAYAMRKTLFGMFGATDHDGIRARARGAYDAYYAEIRRLVPPARRLEYRIGSGWAPLCEFLGKDVPDVPFPHVNDRASHGADMRARRAKGIRKLAKVMLRWGGSVGVAFVVWRLIH